MTPPTGYLPLSQGQDGMASVNSPTPWWAASKDQVAGFTTKNFGLLLVIGSQFFFASMNLSVKLLEKMDPPTPILELITVRMAITVFCFMIFMIANKMQDLFLGPRGVRGLLAAGGLSVFFGLSGLFYSLNYLSLADVTVITFLKPFAVALAGRLLLGESYTRREALAAVCSLVGVILIARPPFLFGSTVEESAVQITPFERLRAVGSTLVGVGGGTATFIIMRAIGPRAHPVHIMTFFSFWCAVAGLIAMAIVRGPVVFPMTWQWIALILDVTIFGVAAQIFLTMGLRHETATRGALCTYTQLLFAVVLELVVFGTVPSLLSTVGAAVIVAAQVYAVFSKQKPPVLPSVALGGAHTSDDTEETPLRSDSVDESQNGEYSFDDV